jgi:hypothetical protein
MRSEIRVLSLVAFCMLAACNLSLFPTTIPVLSNANGASSPTAPAGSTVVLAGAGFGDTQGSGQVVFTPSGGGVPLQATIVNPGGWTQAAIVATVPGGAAGSYVVSVLTGGGITSGGLIFTMTPAVTFNPSAITWTAGPSLAGPVSGTGVAFAEIGSNRYVYAVGGAGAAGAPVATVSYASVGTTGTLGAWLPATSLPAPLAFTGVVAATVRNSAVLSNGYLYAVGGAADAGGTPVITVYRAAINADGSLGTWSTTGSLPIALRSAGVIIQYGSMYVLGGATTGNAPAATAFRSPIQVDGAVTWKPQQSLPSPRARFGYGVAGLYLYAFGGDSISVAPNDTAGAAKRMAQIVYAKLNPSTRDITSWTTAATALTDARSANPAVPGAGKVLLTGGLYSGASTHTSEATYAVLNTDGTVGSFTTATPATSINSLCSCNLFNQGATAYLGGNGSFHVLVVGGDDVSGSGTRRQETFTY